MNKANIEEYLLFYQICHDTKSIDENTEILTLRHTWYYQG